MDANSHAELAIKYLHEVGKSWEFGDRLAEILNGVKNARLTPIMNANANPTSSARTQPIVIPLARTDIEESQFDLSEDYSFQNITPDGEFNAQEFLAGIGIQMAGPMAVFTPYSGDGAAFSQDFGYQDFNFAGGNNL